MLEVVEIQMNITSINAKIPTNEEYWERRKSTVPKNQHQHLNFLQRQHKNNKCHHYNLNMLKEMIS